MKRGLDFDRTIFILFSVVVVLLVLLGIFRAWPLYGPNWVEKRVGSSFSEYSNDLKGSDDVFRGGTPGGGGGGGAPAGYCGDGIVQLSLGEQCDNTRPPTCEKLGLLGGAKVTCDSQCHYDTSLCTTLGAHCPWDQNGDGLVNSRDKIMVSHMIGCAVGMGDSSCNRADINGNLQVGQGDVNLVEEHYGRCKCTIGHMAHYQTGVCTAFLDDPVVDGYVVQRTVGFSFPPTNGTNGTGGGGGGGGGGQGYSINTISPDLYAYTSYDSTPTSTKRDVYRSFIEWDISSIPHDAEVLTPLSAGGTYHGVRFIYGGYNWGSQTYGIVTSYLNSFRPSNQLNSPISIYQSLSSAYTSGSVTSGSQFPQEGFNEIVLNGGLGGEAATTQLQSKIDGEVGRFAVGLRSVTEPLTTNDFPVQGVYSEESVVWDEASRKGPILVVEYVVP